MARTSEQLMVDELEAMEAALKEANKPIEIAAQLLQVRVLHNIHTRLDDIKFEMRQSTEYRQQ